MHYFTMMFALECAGMITTPANAAFNAKELASQLEDSRASLVFDVEDNFVELCRAAEARHRAEMKGWTLAAATRSDSRCSFYNDDERPALYEIRTLATRQY